MENDYKKSDYIVGYRVNIIAPYPKGIVKIYIMNRSYRDKSDDFVYKTTEIDDITKFDSNTLYNIIINLLNKYYDNRDDIKFDYTFQKEDESNIKHLFINGAYIKFIQFDEHFLVYKKPIIKCDTIIHFHKDLCPYIISYKRRNGSIIIHMMHTASRLGASLLDTYYDDGSMFTKVLSKNLRGVFNIKNNITLMFIPININEIYKYAGKDNEIDDYIKYYIEYNHLVALQIPNDEE